MTEAENEAPLPGITPGRAPETARRQEDFNPAAVAKAPLRATGALATTSRNTGRPRTDPPAVWNQ
jgi:hypothetical protein